MTTIATPRRRLTAIRAARLFDGTGDALTPHPVVTVDSDSGRIVSVGTAGPVEAEVVDLGAATLLPGLVDGHVHLAFDASPDPVGALAARDNPAAYAAMLVAARRTAAGGVTTVRDLGDRNYLALRVRDAAGGDRTLPTIVASGPPITTPGGHCHYLGAPASGADGIRAAVRAHADRGVDVIKIMASGGNLTQGSRPELSQFTADELRVAVDEAHACGLPITAHVHGLRAVRDALAAGVDGLEHVTLMTADGVDEMPADLVAALAAAPVTIGLTLGVILAPGAEIMPAMASRLPTISANVRKLHAGGVDLIAGTDAGIGPIKPPDVLRSAIGMLSTAVGMTPAEALRANTARAAVVLGLGDRKGRIAPGYDADLLAVDGDPLTDPAALDAIQAVYVRGARL
ncbi:Imidazolonepropionase [Asanoa ishikariensis]|uniref:Imidazolonepropionase n=1 Tax=Asanoa ishikariensis TaxID=137265 RepID=A0A1H3R918_9ACTN|nr:amidohydrolase family protein [Asanoa ishikariensis]SDZ21761.1 Imidazolonepropionase [Asanoa ishikariensis]